MITFVHPKGRSIAVRPQRAYACTGHGVRCASAKYAKVKYPSGSTSGVNWWISWGWPRLGHGGHITPNMSSPVHTVHNYTTTHVRRCVLTQ